MTPALSPDETDQRLSALPASLRLGTDDSRATDFLLTFRVQHARRKPRGPIRLAAALLAALLLCVAGNAMVAYYAPRYGQALAQVPVLRNIAQPLVRGLGFSDQNAVALNDIAVSNGHSIRLVAGRSDGLGTVILLEIDGRGLSGNPKQYGSHPGDYGIDMDGLTVTDQFGHSYRTVSAGATYLQMEPLAWPASKVGARLTLHAVRLEKLWLIGPGAPANTTLAGDWTLHATLVSAAMHDLSLPPPVRTADATYTVTSIRLTGSALEMHWTVAGPINDQFDRLFYAPGTSGWNPQLRQLSRSYFGAAVLDPSGQPVYGGPGGAGGEWDPGKPFRGDLTVTIAHPGRYQLQLAAVLTSMEDQRWVIIP